MKEYKYQMRVDGLRKEKTSRGTGCMHGHRGSQSNLMWVCPCSILLHQQPAVAAQALMNIKFYQGEMFSDEIYIKTSLDPTLECKTCPFIVNSPWIHKLNLWWCCICSTKGRSIIATLCNDDCCLKWKVKHSAKFWYWSLFNNYIRHYSDDKRHIIFLIL